MTGTKFWALAAVLFLAFCSMLTGSTTLLRSVGNLNRRSDIIDYPPTDDLDVLDAFVAAYEDLTIEFPEVQEAAISEIARMSVGYIELEPPHLHTLVSTIPIFDFKFFCFDRIPLEQIWT
ncbi:unnamed protein product [Fraxinus pennsylvanica]|uniref:Uncharacterized protein n=1 Tax=Fraxinus pennsylvanica TaxID=56036 RepID=A0AAD2DXI3_9LAMI|nr:unnamed protein product [Fraxinus pennsylvanica]